jgi:hypothetical protein
LATWDYPGNQGVEDTHPGDRFFWFSTTGWMMWNLLVSGLFVDEEIVLYDGSLGHPDMGVLRDLAASARASCFGTSAAYVAACMKAGVEPRAGRDLSALRSVGSTGSPLSPEGFRWVAERVGRNAGLFSTSGGTDVCTFSVGSVPTLSYVAAGAQAEYPSGPSRSRSTRPAFITGGSPTQTSQRMRTSLQSMSSWRLAAVSRVGTTPLSKELAEKIGARPEASRPLIGPRQLPSPAQVGSPGKKAAPSVHLAFDISGVTQRRSGTRRSDPIVAAGHSAGADSVDIARELDELS